MAVYDCFLFYNELDVLELRLKTLDPVVDHFVLVEGGMTFSGHPKPLYYAQNKERFGEWAKKIRHIVVPAKHNVTAWDREYDARDWMPMGFQDASPGDFIFQSDADEIWNPEKVGADSGEPGVLVYGQRMFYYRLNCERVPRIIWFGSRRVRSAEWPGGQALRDIKRPVLPDGGWHFSFLGDAKNAVNKLRAYSHTEYSGQEWADEHRIAPLIERGEDLISPLASYLPVKVGPDFPKPLVEEPDRWAKWIR